MTAILATLETEVGRLLPKADSGPKCETHLKNKVKQKELGLEC
jgi:hypothetical protein